MDEEICGRCLINVNITVPVVARFPDGHSEFFGTPTDPLALRKWIEDRWYGEGCTFAVGTTTDRFRSISVWHGDPVCPVHLWWLVDAEAKSYARYGLPVR